MIIVKLIGGLGNQMFQYAIAKHYQLKGETVFLDSSFYNVSRENVTYRQFELSAMPITVPLLPWFIDRLLNSKNIAWKILRRLTSLWLNDVTEKNLEFNPSYLHLRGNSILTGYFQSENYFKDIHKQLRKDFAFPELSPRNLNYAKLIRQSNSVSLHIRRGDYVHNDAINKLHGTLPLSYYKKAIERISKLAADARYFIFTDDPRWAYQNVNKILQDFTVVEDNLDKAASWEDMCLMSMCNHNILANSSFSWWGGWLNAYDKKMIIAPQHWCLDKDMNFQLQALVPSSWIKIDNHEFTEN